MARILKGNFFLKQLSAVVFFSLVFLGCDNAERNTRTPFPSLKVWEQIKMGMTEQQVIKLLGEPADRQVQRFPEDNCIARMELIYGTPVNPHENFILYVVLMGGDGRVIETNKALQD